MKVGFLVSGVRTFPNGAMIAVDEVNGHGGLLGRSVELIVRMGLEEAAEAVDTAEAMIHGDEVVALIGPNRSAHAIMVGAVAQRAGSSVHPRCIVETSHAIADQPTSVMLPTPLDSTSACSRQEIT